MSNVMLAKDSISAALAQCYVTIGERRYNLMTAIKMEAKFKKNKVKIPSLGKTGKGNKSVSWEGTGSCTMHYNTSIFREMMFNFKDTGDDVYFEMEITNDDPSSDAGSQTITLLQCNIDGGVLAKFDASSDSYLDEDVDFTFDDFDMPKKFEELIGLAA